MGINLAGLVEAIGAGAQGYGRGVQIRRQNEREDARDARQKKIDERQDLQFQRQDSEYQEAQALKDGIKGALADVTPVDKQDTSLPLPMQVPKYEANGQSFETEDAARQALAGQNSLSAKHARAADAASKLGAVDQAARFRALADQYHVEGSKKVLDAIEANAPQFEALGKGPLRMAIPKEAIEAFNGIGSMRLDPNAQVEYLPGKDAAGRPTVNARVLDGKGNVLLSDTRAARLMLLDAEKREQVQRSEQQLALSAGSQAEQVRHNKSVEQRMDRAAAEAKAERAAAKAERTAERNRDPVAEKIKAIETHLGPLDPERKKAVASKLLGLTDGKDGKELDKLVDGLVKTYAQNSPDITPAQLAKYRVDLKRDLRDAERDTEVVDAVSEELSRAQGTNGYAAAYDKAKRLGLSDDDLAAMNFPAPVAAGAAPGAARATGAARAAAGTMRPPVKAEPQNHKANPTPYMLEQQREAQAEQAEQAKRRAQDIGVLQNRIAMLEKDARTPRNQAQLAADRKRLAALQDG